MGTNSNNRRLALLIDGDNAQASLVGEIVTEAGKYGSVTIRRIYGDWTTANMSGWKDSLQTHAIQPIQQFRNTIGKNATDSAMIIDAMDILHSENVDGFCLVSSDSDYTRLATRIREQGVFVMGVGRRQTPRAFISACDVFIFTENLSEAPVEKPASDLTLPPRLTGLLPILRQACEMASQEDGWAALGGVGNYLRRLDASFDARTYGFTHLSDLIKAFDPQVEIRQVPNPGGLGNALYIRFREDNPPKER